MVDLLHGPGAVKLLLVVASLLSVFIVGVAALIRKVQYMSASTDSLFAAVSDLSVQVASVKAKVDALKAGQADPADAAVVAQAVVDIKAATAALAAAIA